VLGRLLSFSGHDQHTGLVIGYGAGGVQRGQATWRLPPLPELDQILARVLSDRFGLPAPAAA
jgi:hypothetical protein